MSVKKTSFEILYLYFNKNEYFGIGYFLIFNDANVHFFNGYFLDKRNLFAQTKIAIGCSVDLIEISLFEQ